METPVRERVVTADAAGGYMVSSGVRRLRDVFRNEDSSKQFYDWSTNFVTRTIVSALRDMAVNGPVGVDTKDVGVQYGITLGLGIAANLMTDPSIVYPELFANAVNQTVQVLDNPDFSVSPHEALDNLGEQT